MEGVWCDREIIVQGGILNFPPETFSDISQKNH